MCVFPADTAHLEASQGGAGPLANPASSLTLTVALGLSQPLLRRPHVWCGAGNSVSLCPSLPASHRVLTGDEKGNRGDKSIQEGVLLGKFDKGVLTSDGWLIE